MNQSYLLYAFIFTEITSELYFLPFKMFSFTWLLYENKSLHFMGDSISYLILSYHFSSVLTGFSSILPARLSV